jgi:hypothetical protein
MNPAQQMPVAHECWSVDQEHFQSGTLVDLLSNHSELTPGVIVWRGIAVHPNNTHLCDGNDVIDTMADRACDFAGEHAEDYPAVSDDARAELDQLLSDWIDKYAPPHFFQVESVEPYTLTNADFITAEDTQ